MWINTKQGVPGDLACSTSVQEGAAKSFSFSCWGLGLVQWRESQPVREPQSSQIPAPSLAALGRHQVARASAAASPGRCLPDYLISFHKANKDRKEDGGWCCLGVLSKVLNHIVKGIL